MARILYTEWRNDLGNIRYPFTDTAALPLRLTA